MWYEYNGAGRLAELRGTGTGMKLRYYSSTDTYDGWDRFGRVKQQQWKKSTTVYDQFDYTYDYAGNRVTRDVVATGVDRDQKYSYDGLHRLSQANEGTLDGNKDITNANADFRQKWTLDQLGNWGEFQQDGLFDHAEPANNDFTDGDDIDQSRLHNKANEIDNNEDHGDAPSGTISDSTGTGGWALPKYDAAGNMITMPKPKDLANGYTAKYDAWNRLITLDDSGTVQTNEYDGLHRRIQRKEGPTTCPR